MKTEITNHAQHYALIQSLLDDPSYDENPLKPALEMAFKFAQASDSKLTRLIRISDGYYSMHTHSLVANNHKQTKLFNKVSKISDTYQEHMRELNEHLKFCALHDPLTRLPNRRMFLSRLQEEEARSKRSEFTFCLAILDIDFFKHINDQFGHDVGDTVLVCIANAIFESLREYDLCARWGGEEFIFLLPNTDLCMAHSVADRMLKAIHVINIPEASLNLNLTASIGLTLYDGHEPYDQTIKRADDALLKAKRLGRNRIEIDT